MSARETMTTERRIKFGIPGLLDAALRYDYGDVYDVQTEDYGRLMIGPSANHTALLFELAGCWEVKSFWLLYVLVVDRGTHQAGRYQSPRCADTEELRAFLAKYASFLEQDGRHTFWIASESGEGTLVYDRHNVIFAYGPTEKYQAVLQRHGFTESAVAYPEPHMHLYYEEFDGAEEEVLSFWDWQFSPLQEESDY
jgi:hypothetical protein